QLTLRRSRVPPALEGAGRSVESLVDVGRVRDGRCGVRLLGRWVDDRERGIRRRRYELPVDEVLQYSLAHGNHHSQQTRNSLGSFPLISLNSPRQCAESLV